MASITLSAYEIKVHLRGDQENSQDLSDFAQGNDLLDFFINFIGGWTHSSSTDSDLIDNEKIQKLIRLKPDSLIPLGREFSGILESGDYGYEAPIIDKNSGQRVHLKELDQAEMIPFFFQIHIPRNGRSGILIVQRFKQHGIFGLLRNILKSEFRNNFQQYVLDISPLVSDEIVDDFIRNGRLNRITFKRLELTPDIINQADSGSANSIENVGRIEYSIIANRGRSLPFLSRIRNAVRQGDVALDGLYNINGFDYNSISVSVKLNGHTRTLDLSSLNNIGAFFDISNEVEINEETGHPEEDSIRQLSRRILDDLLITINPDSIDE